MRAAKTIQSSDDIARVLQNGRRYRARSFVVFVLAAGLRKPGSDQALRGRVAFIAPKRLGNAVCRNRCKRVLRAGMQAFEGNKEGKELIDSNDIIIMANNRTEKASSAEISHELEDIIKKILFAERQLV